MSASTDIHIGMDSDFDHQSGSSPPKTQPKIVANFLKIATAIAECGVPVMPLTPLSKDAFLPKWQTCATTDAAQILEWTRQNPAYNCGAVARKGEYWFLDIDNPVVFGMIERDTGHSLKEIETVVVNSSGEKQHLYFQHDARSVSIGNRSLDVGGKEMFSVRAHNQYVVVAGSIHPKTGQPYKLMRTPPVGESIPVAPAWLTDWIDAHAPREPVTAMPKDWNETFTISEGERDKWLFAQACKLRDDLYPKETVLTLLRALNTAHCVPPMDDTTVRAKVTSAFKRPPRDLRHLHLPCLLSMTRSLKQ